MSLDGAGGPGAARRRNPHVARVRTRSDAGVFLLRAGLRHLPDPWLRGVPAAALEGAWRAGIPFDRDAARPEVQTDSRWQSVECDALVARLSGAPGGKHQLVAVGIADVHARRPDPGACLRRPHEQICLAFNWT